MSSLALTLELSDEQIDVVARRVIDLLKEERGDGFYDVAGAARFLCCSKKAIYHLKASGKLIALEGTGRLLFTREALEVAAR